MLLFSSKGYEYTWTEPHFNHILWGCAGKWFHTRLKVYVNADVGKGFAAVCWNNPRFFQPCSQFVNPAAFMAKPRWDWSQILLRVQVSLWRSLWGFPIATGAVGTAGNDWELWLQQCWWRRARPQSFIQPHKIFLGLMTDTGRDLLFNDLVCGTGRNVLCLKKMKSWICGCVKESRWDI